MSYHIIYLIISYLEEINVHFRHNTLRQEQKLIPVSIWNVWPKQHDVWLLTVNRYDTGISLCSFLYFLQFDSESCTIRSLTVWAPTFFSCAQHPNSGLRRLLVHVSRSHTHTHTHTHTHSRTPVNELPAGHSGRYKTQHTSNTWQTPVMLADLRLRPHGQRDRPNTDVRRSSP